MKSQSSQLFLYHVPTQGAKCTSVHRHKPEGDLGWLPCKGKEERGCRRSCLEGSVHPPSQLDFCTLVAAHGVTEDREMQTPQKQPKWRRSKHKPKVSNSPYTSAAKDAGALGQLVKALHSL